MNKKTTQTQAKIQVGKVMKKTVRHYIEALILSRGEVRM